MPSRLFYPPFITVPAGFLILYLFTGCSSVFYRGAGGRRESCVVVEIPDDSVRIGDSVDH